MHHLTAILATAALAIGLSGPVAANTAGRVIDDRREFVDLVQGKQLTLPGIRLSVTPDGRITGRAYGRDVSGAWEWNGGYFCRSLFWGERDLGPNCQQVKLEGGKLRFTSDRGAGQSATLTLQ